MPRYQGFVYALVLLPLAAAGCNSAVELNDPITAESQSLSRPCPPDTPKELNVPDGNELSLVADAEGVQVYTCKQNPPKDPPDPNDVPTWSWAFDRPDALLFGNKGRVIAHHYEGPTWEGLDDSAVVGGMAVSAKVDATAIPWLRLTAVDHKGDGIFSRVTFIQRLRTENGLAPTTSCGKRTKAPM